MFVVQTSSELTLYVIEMHAGFGLWLRAHVCKAVWLFLGEVNLNKQEIETDLNQQENVKANFIVQCKNGWEGSCPFWWQTFLIIVITLYVLLTGYFTKSRQLGNRSSRFLSWRPALNENPGCGCELNSNLHMNEWMRLPTLWGIKTARILGNQMLTCLSSVIPTVWVQQGRMNVCIQSTRWTSWPMPWCSILIL